MYWTSPDVVMISPRCSHDIPPMYWTPPDVLNIPDVLNTPNQKKIVNEVNLKFWFYSEKPELFPIKFVL